MKRSLLTVTAISLLGSVQVSMSAEPRAARQVSADQAMACIRLALTATPGQLRELEIKVENQRTICEVEVIGAGGKKFEVYVDVLAGKVTRVMDD